MSLQKKLQRRHHPALKTFRKIKNFSFIPCAEVLKVTPAYLQNVMYGYAQCSKKLDQKIRELAESIERELAES